MFGGAAWPPPAAERPSARVRQNDAATTARQLVQCAVPVSYTHLDVYKRQDEAIKDTLVLMLTAKGRETDLAKGLGVGADAYMTKPFSTKDLVAKVRDLLAGEK